MGVHLIKNDGTVDFFCSSKCRKNDLNLGRDKRKMKWTEAYRLDRTKAASDVARAKAKDVEREAAKKAPVKVEVKAEKKAKK